MAKRMICLLTKMNSSTNTCPGAEGALVKRYRHAARLARQGPHGAPRGARGRAGAGVRSPGCRRPSPARHSPPTASYCRTPWPRPPPLRPAHRSGSPAALPRQPGLGRRTGAWAPWNPSAISSRGKTKADPAPKHGGREASRSPQHVTEARTGPAGCARRGAEPRRNRKRRQPVRHAAEAGGGGDARSRSAARRLVAEGRAHACVRVPFRVTCRGTQAGKWEGEGARASARGERREGVGRREPHVT